MKNCNKLSYDKSNSWKHLINYEKLSLYFTEYVSIILTVIICFIGITTNSITAVVISIESKSKRMVENHYQYMKINAIVNVLILAIYLLSTLLSECQGDYGLFCSPARTLMFSQYFKIIFNEYFSNVLRLISNFAYVGFAISRISLVGKNHGKLITTISSKLTPFQFMQRVLLPCLILPVVKVFRFMPNKFHPYYDYPNPIAFIFNKIDVSLVFVYLSFNILFDIVNYVGFLILNFVLDLNLMLKMKSTIKEKEKNKSELVGALVDKQKSQQNKRYIFLKLYIFFSN